MKTRKLFTRAIAVVACLLMFSTNVLAATVSIDTGATTVMYDGEERPALQVTLTAEAGDLVTFLAVDADTDIADIAGNAEKVSKVRAIDQKKADDEGKVVITVPYLDGFAEKLNLYAKSEKDLFESLNSLADVRMVASATLVEIPEGDAIPVYEYAITEDTATAPETPENLRNFFAEQGGVKVKYCPVGMTAAEEAAVVPIECNNETKDDFEFALGVPTGDIYDIVVTYKGIELGDKMPLKAPVSPTSIVVENADTVFDAYYDGDAHEPTVEEIVYAITNNVNDINANKNVTITANYESGDPVVMDLEDLVLNIDATGGEIYGEPYTHAIELELYGVTASAPIYINFVPRTITGATANDVTISAFEGTVIDAAYAKGNVPAANLGFKFTWNDVKKDAGHEETTDMTFEQIGEPTTDGEGNKVYVFDVTLNDANGTPRTARFNLTVVETTMTSIKGTVKAFDTTGQFVIIGQNDNFANAIPVGAVVTAIPYNATAIGNFRGTTESYMPISTVVNDATGEFTLNVDPNTKYTLIISHTKYIVNNIGTENQAVYVANSILDANTLKTIDPIGYDVKNLGTINIRYAFMGDIDSDGKIDNVEAELIRGKFGSTVAAAE